MSETITTMTIKISSSSFMVENVLKQLKTFRQWGVKYTQVQLPLPVRTYAELQTILYQVGVP